MEKFTQKWAIVALLEQVAEGTEFYYTDFPLHITLAGVFKIDYDGMRLKNELPRVLSDQKPLLITVGEKDIFGPDKDVAVMRIMKTPELMSLYDKIYSWLNQSGAVHNEPQYEGTDYLPHSTMQKAARLIPGETRQIQSVSIVDLFPNGDGLRRKVFKTIEFK